MWTAPPARAVSGAAVGAGQGCRAGSGSVGARCCTLGLREVPGIKPGLSLLRCLAWSHPSSKSLESKRQSEVSYTQ